MFMYKVLKGRLWHKEVTHTTGNSNDLLNPPHQLQECAMVEITLFLIGTYHITMYEFMKRVIIMCYRTMKYNFKKFFRFFSMPNKSLQWKVKSKLKWIHFYNYFRFWNNQCRSQNLEARKNRIGGINTCSLRNSTQYFTLNVWRPLLFWSRKQA